MILLWCTIAVMIALCFARYNQSNNLFWILLISFLLGITGASVFNKLVENKHQSEIKLTQVCPTQDVQDAVNYISYTNNVFETYDTSSKPSLVSKDYTSEQSEQSFTISKWVQLPQTPPPKALL